MGAVTGTVGSLALLEAVSSALGQALLTPRGGSIPLPVLSWNSERKRVMRSEGMAKEMPKRDLERVDANDLTVLGRRSERAVTLGAKWPLPTPSGRAACPWDLAPRWGPP